MQRCLARIGTFNSRSGVSALHTLASVTRLHEDGQLSRAIQVAEQLHNEESAATADILCLLLQGCIDNEDLSLGRRVHRLIKDCGFEKNSFLGSHLIRMFALFGSFDEAKQVFEKMPTHTVFTWNAYITACTLNATGLQAVDAYRAMQLQGVLPDQHIFVNVLSACAKAELVDYGKLIHYQIMVSLPEPNAYIENTLIDMYVKCHALGDALSVFERASSRDVMMWTTIIIGTVVIESGLEAVRYFQQMLCEGILPNSVTYIGVFKACSNVNVQHHGPFFHSCIINDKLQFNQTLGDALVAMYAKSGRLMDAFAMLDFMPEHDLVTFNMLIAAFVQQGQGRGAFWTYQKLHELALEPNEVTFMSILPACRDGCLEKGQVIHMDIIEHTSEMTLSVNNALVGMYDRCGSSEDACAVLQSFPEHDTVSWNTLIASHLQQKQYFEAFNAYNQMQENGVSPDKGTFANMLEVCTSLASLAFGHLFHASILLFGIGVDFYLCSCLVGMYSNCRSHEDACRVSEKATQNGITCGKALSDSTVCKAWEDMSLKEESITAGINFTKLLRECSSLNALELGRHVHCCVAEGFLDLDTRIGNSLVGMYAKCGSVEDAYGVLCKVSMRDAVTWTALISGCGRQMDWQSTSQFYMKMMKEGIAPVETTYICLLAACSRTGIWEEGRWFFESTLNEFANSAAPDHYYCMVNLLGRSGKLIEADDVLQTIPLASPSAVGQRALLNHLWLHRSENFGFQW